MARKKKSPTPPKPGDTLDRLPTFSLARELYEGERKEIYIGVRGRLSELKSQRKKVADTLGIPVAEEKEVSRVIALYEGDDGILALFQNAEEEEEHAAERVKKGEGDTRQRELPIDRVPTESTEETRASREPVGVDQIDALVTAVGPFAPSDIDWDAFRREVLNMSGDERAGVLEYAKRYHQFVMRGAPGTPAPQMPGGLHGLFVDLSPAYAQAMGQRDDVVYATDIERAMTRAKAKARPTAERDGAPTKKQLAALEAIAGGHADTVTASMYRKLVSLGLATASEDGKGAAVTDSGKLFLEIEGVNADVAKLSAEPSDREHMGAPSAGYPSAENSRKPEQDAQREAQRMLAAAAEDMAEPRSSGDPAADAWLDEPLREAGDVAPVVPLAAVAEQESVRENAAP